MTRCILLFLVLCFPAYSQTQSDFKSQLAAWNAETESRTRFEAKGTEIDPSKAQTTFRRDTQNMLGAVVTAYRYVWIVYDDKGRQHEILIEKKGKLRHSWDLRRGESWVRHDYDFRVHRATVTITEVDGPPFSLPSVGKRE